MRSAAERPSSAATEVACGESNDEYSRFNWTHRAYGGQAKDYRLHGCRQGVPRRRQREAF